MFNRRAMPSGDIPLAASASMISMARRMRLDAGDGVRVEPRSVMPAIGQQTVDALCLVFCIMSLFSITAAVSPMLSAAVLMLESGGTVCVQMS